MGTKVTIHHLRHRYHVCSEVATSSITVENEDSHVDDLLLEIPDAYDEKKTRFVAIHNNGQVYSQKESLELAKIAKLA